MNVYACYNKDIQERMKSSSGGIYPLIAKSVLEQGGVVFAACYDADLNVKHVSIWDVKELEKTQGSKYSPSVLGDTFVKIKEILKKNKRVLFVGTPCQCEGLVSFLKNSSCSMENLLCVDFVCHGIPSRKAWEACLKNLERCYGELVSINMRDKESGWSKYNYSWKICNTKGKSIVIPQSDISFMKGFAADLYLRPACYQCRFKKLNRETDITLADYWGVWEIQPQMDDDKGTSLVFLHSKKGKEIFDVIKEELVFEKVVVENVIKYNPSIIESAELNHGRKKFFKCLSKDDDFSVIVEKLLKKSVFVRIKQRIKEIVK